MIPDNNKNYISAAKVLRINVGFITAQDVGYYSDTQIEIPSPVLLSDDVLVEHLYISLRLSNAHNGIVVRGQVETSIQTDCSRCMDLIPLPIEFQFDEVFSTGQAIDTQYQVDDSNVIDLTPLVREEALLNIPMVTPYDDQKRCLFCERTFEDILREHGLEDDIDPRLEALKVLKDRLNDAEE